MRVTVGAHVLFGKYAGQETLIGDTPVVILREDDILVILEEG
jgi:co-chaperonin GroES (HSP10)